MVLSITLAILSAILIFYYFHYCKVKRFRDAGIPFKMPNPILGNTTRAFFQHVTMSDLFCEVCNNHPDAKYVGFFDKTVPTIIISDVDLIKSITVKNFDHFRNRTGLINEQHDPILGLTLLSLKDDAWKNIRQTMNPLFASSKMKSMFHLMSECAKNFATFLAEQPAERSVLEIKDIFTAYANDIIASFAFGINVDSMKNPDNAFHTVGKEITKFNVPRSLRFFFARQFPLLSRYLGVNLMDDKARNLIVDTIETAIRERDQKGITRPDIIQLMMNIRDNRTDKALTTEEMISQSFMFYIAGFETVSTLLTFLCYQLVMNPHIYEKLEIELDSMNEKCEGDLTYEDVNDLVYLEAVINETLRLNPPAQFFDRVCTKDFEFPPALPGGKPYWLRKDDVIFISPLGVHRNSKYYEDPYSFKPERFLEKGKRLASSPAFIPFGIGPRMCIGQRFTMLETKVCLFYLLTKCRLSLCARTPRKPVISGLAFSLIIDGGMWLDVRAREEYKRSAEASSTKNQQS